MDRVLAAIETQGPWRRRRQATVSVLETILNWHIEGLSLLLRGYY